MVITNSLADFRWDVIAASRVAVIGDFCVDVYWQVDESGVSESLETGEPVHRVAGATLGLGGAGNVVANLAALGVRQIRALGVRGPDGFGHELAGRLAEFADTSALFDLGEGWTTYAYVKPIHGRQERSRYDLVPPRPLPHSAVTAVQQALQDAAAWADVLLVNQQVEGVLTNPAVQDAVNDVIASHPRLVVLVDARDVADRLRGGVMKLNRDEAARLFAADDTSTAAVLAAAARAARLDGVAKFVTLGEAGIAVVDAGGVQVLPAVDVPAEIDPVGAGDTVLAALGAAMGAGHDLATSAALANLAASVTVQKLQTTGTASAAEIIAAGREPMLAHQVELAAAPERATHLQGSEIEVVDPIELTEPVRHVVFDHDGTLSSLRAGWEAVMTSLMEEVLVGDGMNDSARRELIRKECTTLIERTTGAPTLLQMEGLVDLVAKFGAVGRAKILDAEGYKVLYLERLGAMVSRRTQQLQLGELPPSAFHIRGATDFLKALDERQVGIHLASGTDVGDVISDAAALGYAGLFAGRIYGSGSAPGVDAKRLVIGSLAEQCADRRTIAVFGDGPVEMREARRVGALAIGVCSDEVRGHGVNLAKRSRLIRAGAHFVIPEFSHIPHLLALLRLGSI